MAVEVGTAVVSIIPSARGFGSALQSQVNRDAGSVGKKAGTKMGGGLLAGVKGALGPLAGIMAAATAGAFLKGAITEASDLGESVNALNVTYGKHSREIQKLGRQAAQSLGLSNVEFNSLAVRFSGFAKTISGKGGDVTKTLDDLTTRAADFASVMNLEVNEAAELFQSGLAGETEPLRKFGIDLSAAAVEAHAYKAGIAEAGAELTENQKVQARYSLLMKSTSKTQGDFENTSDSLANTQRRLGALWDNLQADLGKGLLPILERAGNWIIDNGIPAVKNFIKEWKTGEGVGGQFRDAFEKVAAILADVYKVGKDVTGWLIEHKNGVLAVTSAVLAGVVAYKAFLIVNSVLKAIKVGIILFKAWRAGTLAMTAAQLGLNLAMTLNPIGLVIAGIAALVVGLVVAWKKSEKFREVVGKVWDWLKDKTKYAVLWIVDKILWFAQRVVEGADKAFGWLPGIGDMTKKALGEIKKFRAGVNKELDAIKDENVNISVLTSRAKSGDVGGMFRDKVGMMGGAGRIPHGAMGGGLHFKTHAPVGNVRNIATDVQSEVEHAAQKIADRLRRTIPGFGAPGSVLPKGAYSIGMPYLGYPGHYGADYPAATGTPIFSPWSGRVTSSYDLPGSNPYNGTPYRSYGRLVRVAHGDGSESLFAHLNTRNVATGQLVKAGQIIGTVGMNGNATGPHLHYEYRRGGRTINPATLGIFDTGGVLGHGGAAVNLSGKPERVLDPRTTRNFERLTDALDKGRGGTVALTITNWEQGKGYLRVLARDEIEGDAEFNATRRRMT